MANIYEDSEALKVIKINEKILKKMTSPADKIENSQKHIKAAIEQSKKWKKF